MRMRCGGSDFGVGVVCVVLPILNRSCVSSQRFGHFTEILCDIIEISSDFSSRLSELILHTLLCGILLFLLFSRFLLFSAIVAHSLLPSRFHFSHFSQFPSTSQRKNSQASLSGFTTNSAYNFFHGCNLILSFSFYFWRIKQLALVSSTPHSATINLTCNAIGHQKKLIAYFVFSTRR